MKKKYFIYVMFSIPFFFGSIKLWGQTNEVKSEYIYFDALIGAENTDLYHGVLYTEKYRTINDKKQFFKPTKFLDEKIWYKGELYTNQRLKNDVFEGIGKVWYRGQPYFNQHLKYDVFEDNVLLRLKDEVGGSTLILVKTDLDSFSLNGHDFINVKLPKDTKDVQSGFHEVLFQGLKTALYVKHHKNFVKKKDKKFGYYEFIDIAKNYVLHYDKMYYTVNSKKSILRLFPEYKEQINNFYKKSRKAYGKKEDVFMIELIKQLESIL